jgi:hypothetical protein
MERPRTTSAERVDGLGTAVPALLELFDERLPVAFLARFAGLATARPDDSVFLDATLTASSPVHLE